MPTSVTYICHENIAIPLPISSALIFNPLRTRRSPARSVLLTCLNPFIPFASGMHQQPHASTVYKVTATQFFNSKMPYIVNVCLWVYFGSPDQVQAEKLTKLEFRKSTQKSLPINVLSNSVMKHANSSAHLDLHYVKNCILEFNSKMFWSVFTELEFTPVKCAIRLMSSNVYGLGVHKFSGRCSYFLHGYHRAYSWRNYQLAPNVYPNTKQSSRRVCKSQSAAFRNIVLPKIYSSQELVLQWMSGRLLRPIAIFLSPLYETHQLGEECLP